MDEVKKNPMEKSKQIRFSKSFEQVLVEEVVDVQEKHCTYASFEEDGSPNLAIEVRDRGIWLWVSSKTYYEGNTWDYTTDRLSGDPYSAEVFHNWIGKITSAPTDVSSLEDLTQWSLFHTRYVREFTDVGVWGVHEDRYVEDVALDGIVKVYSVGNRRFQDVSPIATMIQEQLDLSVFDDKSPDELVLLLQDSNVLVREIATRLLGRIGDTQTVDHLILASSDENTHVRNSAIESLGEVGGIKAIQTLGSILVEEKYPTNATITALAKIGKPALDTLIPLLKSENDQTSNAAAKLIAGIGGKKAIQYLSEAIIERREKRAIYTLKTIIQSLGEMGAKDALDRISACLDDEDTEVQKFATKSLGSLGDQRAIEPLVKGLYTSEYWTRKMIAESLGELGWNPLDDQKSWLYYVNEDWENLFGMGDDAVDTILRALQEEDPNCQGRILLPLAKSGLTFVDSRIGESIIRLYRREGQTENRKHDAIAALICTPNSDVISFLIQEYMNPETDYLQRKILKTIEELVKTGYDLAEPLVTNLTQNNNENTIGKDTLHRIKLLSIVPLTHQQLKTLRPLIDKVKKKTRNEEVSELVSGLILLDEIRPNFTADEFQVRKKAIEDIDKYHLPSAIGPLIEALGDRHQYIRGKAARVIGNIGLGAVAKTIAALDSGDYRIRMGAAEALGRLRFATATEPLLNALDDENEIVRQNVAWALGRLYLNHEEFMEIRGRVIEALAWLMDSDDYLPARANAVLSLAYIEDERVIESLFKAVDHPNKEFRLNGSLGFIRQAHNLTKESVYRNRVIDKLIAILDDPVKEVRYNAADGLRIYKGKKALRALVALRNDSDEELRELAERGIKEIKEWGDKERTSWGYTERAYYELRDPKAIDELIPFFMDDDLKVQRETQIQIGKFGNIAYDRMMELLLDKEQHYKIRMGAAATLGDIGDIRATDALINALHDVHEDVRCNAAWALAELKDIRSVEALLEATRDTNWQVRVNVAAAFGKIGGRTSFEAILDLIDDEHPQVRLVATSYLASFDEPEVRDALYTKLSDEDALVREMARSWIDHLESKNNKPRD